jgi:molecular chaperone DnaJ
MRRSIFGTVMTSRPCSRCGGRGEEIASPCTACRGDGRVPANQTVAVEVPPGVAHGMELRVEAAGEGGRRGAPPGDLYLTLSVEPHPVFARRGSDLICALEVPLTTAILGGEIEIETLDGAVPIEVAAGTASGSVLHLRGKGVPHLGRRGRGDLLVRVDVDVPAKLGKQERRLVEQLAEERGERGRLRGRLRPPE